jgi:hypothetical protein
MGYLYLFIMMLVKSIETNQIKILDCLICSHQDSLLDPEEWLDQ